MNIKTQHAIAVAACLTLGSGCMLFPSSFDGEDESAEGGATADAALADHCIADVPTWASAHMPRLVSFDNLSDNITDLNTCGLAGARTSAEGFFAVEAEQGQRWHIMARPMDDAADVSVQIFSTCDERSCLRAQEACAHGHAEHLNFVAETAGSYLIAVESDMGGDVQVLATSPACGDGMVQHGEVCDDGNREALDGCTPSCQAELLTVRETEAEPNNERFEANIIRWEDEAAPHIQLTGQLGGACDIDTYEFEVYEGGSIHAEVFDAQNAACESGIPPVEISLVDTRDYTVRGTLTANGNCPVLDDSAGFASDLPAGTYQLRLEAPHLDDGHASDAGGGETGGHSDDGGHSESTTGDHGGTSEGEHGGTTGGHEEGTTTGGHSGESGHSDPSRTTAGEPDHSGESGGHGGEESGGHSGETGGSAEGGHDGHGGGGPLEGDPELFVYHLHIRVGEGH